MNKILITFLLLVSQLVYSQTTPPIKKVLAAGSDGNALPINNLSGLSIGSNAATANIPLWISKDQTGTVSNRIANIHTGTSSLVEFYLENSSSNIKLRKLSTGFTTSGILVANAGVLDNSAGDLIIKNSSGSPIIFGGSTTEWGRFDGTTFSTPAATHSTSTTSPLIIGGSGTTQTLTYKTTTGVGATGADHIFQVGSNGATEAMRIVNSGMVGIGISPTSKLHVNSNAGVNGGILLSLGANSGTPASSYSSIDFTVPTTGLVGQFLATASNYSSSGINLAANSIFLASEATSGQLALMAGGTSGYMTFNTGGYGTANERIRIIAGGNTGFGVTSPSAVIHLKAGTATASTPPLKFTSGTNTTTAEAGAMEYNGTNLFFTRSGTTRENVITTSAVNSVSPTSPNRTLTVVIDGTTYYIHAKTTND